MLAFRHAHTRLSCNEGRNREDHPRLRARSRRRTHGNARRHRRHRPTGISRHLGRPAQERLARGHRGPAPRLGSVLEAARNAGAEIAIIDTAPHASDAALAAAPAADLILIPCRASVADLAAIGASVEFAQIAGTTALAAITQATVGSTLVAEAREAIAGCGIACAPVVVHHRLDHVRAFTDGLTAEEYAPGSKAASEIGELWAWIRSQGDTTRGESQ